MDRAEVHLLPGAPLLRVALLLLRHPRRRRRRRRRRKSLTMIWCVFPFVGWEGEADDVGVQGFGLFD